MEPSTMKLDKFTPPTTARPYSWTTRGGVSERAPLTTSSWARTPSRPHQRSSHGLTDLSHAMKASTTPSRVNRIFGCTAHEVLGNAASLTKHVASRAEVV